MIDRLAEVLLIQILRGYLEATDRPSGFLTALRDPDLAEVLRAIHDCPSRHWTVDDLAAIPHLSRSAFADRFRQSVGASPMRYIQQWRLIKAREYLITTRMTLNTIANKVGYDSQWAFAKAMKREFGLPPGKIRSAAKAS